MPRIVISTDRYVRERMSAAPQYDPVLEQSLREEIAKELERFVQQTWQEAVSGRKLEGMSRPIHAPTYARSIRTNITSNFRYVEAWSEDPSADKIEQGHARLDLKPAMLASGRARRGKGGTRYLIVPFRHRTPGNDSPASGFLPPMPSDVYRVAKGGRRIAGSSEMGLRGIRSKTPLATGGNAYTWKAGSYGGLKRYGGPKDGKYFTFRTVSDHSDPHSWVLPMLPPNRITDAVERYVSSRLDDRLLTIGL